MKGIKHFSMSLLISILSFTISALSCSNFEINGREPGPPKISVSATPGNLRLEDENNSTYVVEAIGIEIRIDCWAPYPIDVEFKGHLSNRLPKVGAIQRTAVDPSDPSTFCFSINITVASFEQITGEYACFSVTNRSTRSSAYIYHSAHPPETLYNRGQSIFVEMKRDEDWLMLPCATSNPQVPVHLYQRDGTEEVRLRVDGQSLKYDPKVGFKILKIVINPSQSVSLFQCRTNTSINDRVDIAVLPPRELIFTPPDPILILREGDRLNLTCESSQDIFIDSSNTEVQGEVRGRPRYETRNLEYLLSFVTGALRAGEGGTVSCRFKSNNGSAHDWKFNVIESPDNKSDPEIPPVLQGLNPFLCRIPGKPTQLALHACNNWVECNLRACHSQDRTCESHECKNSKTSSCVPNGVIQCFNAYNQSVQTQIYFSGLHHRNRTYTQWSAAPKEDILKVRQLKLDHLHQPSLKEVDGSLENLEVVCEGSSFVFAIGFKWFLVSGKAEVQVPIPDEHVQHKWRRLNSKNIIKSVAKISIPRGTSHILCKAPVWNSTEWKEDRISVVNIFDEFRKFHPVKASPNTSSSSAVIKTSVLNSLFFILVKASQFRTEY